MYIEISTHSWNVSEQPQVSCRLLLCLCEIDMLQYICSEDSECTLEEQYAKAEAKIRMSKL